MKRDIVTKKSEPPWRIKRESSSMHKSFWTSAQRLAWILGILFSYLSFAGPAFAGDSSWAGVWSGTIGKSNVRVCLSNGKSAYRYLRYQTDIPLTLHGNEWEETVKGVVSGIWKLGDVQGEKLEGEWQSPRSGKTLPIRLTRLADGGTSTPCASQAYLDKLNGTSSLPAPQGNVGIPGLENVRDIAVGKERSCALLGDGDVKCWRMDESTKKLVFDDMHRSGVDAIAVQGSVLCTLFRDKTVSCDGGQLNNIKFDNFGHSAPVSIAISPSGDFVCVLGSDGRVQCTGDNKFGQLGDGSAIDSHAPVFVKELTDAKSVALGWATACAVLKTGQVKCWGQDFISQKSVPKPTDIRGVSNAKSLAIGGDYACALLGNGTAKCWGNNENGQLGNGVPEPKTLVVDVVGLNDAVVILENDRGNTCGLLRTGGVKCWGVSFGDALDHASVATNIEGISKAISLATSSLFFCDIERNKTVQCGNFDSPFIYKIMGLDDVIKLVGSGETNMCALIGNGRVKCWDLFHLRNSNVPGSVIFMGEQ